MRDVFEAESDLLVFVFRVLYRRRRGCSRRRSRPAFAVALERRSLCGRRRAAHVLRIRAQGESFFGKDRQRWMHRNGAGPGPSMGLRASFRDRRKNRRLSPSAGTGSQVGMRKHMCFTSQGLSRDLDRSPEMRFDDFWRRCARDRTAFGVRCHLFWSGFGLLLHLQFRLHTERS